MLNIKNFLPKHMEDRGLLSLKENIDIINNIIEQRKVPKKGLKEEHIKLLLRILSFMDTDKDPKVIQIGEREGRVLTNLQRESVFDFCHGVGRSGNLTDPQPKAPGASIMYKLTNKILESFLKELGLNVNAIATPVATGMSIGLVLSTVRKIYKSDVVIYPYAAHKSPIKATSFVGFRMRIVDTELFGDALKVPVDNIEKAIKKEENPVVLSTLTFFPPREEDIVDIAKLCEEYDVPHIINGAYAIQNTFYIDKLNKAFKYRVDAVVSSTDKNLFTPIGGAFIYTKNKKFLKEISFTYPGRASANPIANTLISLLYLGVDKYKELMKEQKRCKKLLDEQLEELCKKIDERVLKVKNPISTAITLKNSLDVAKKLYNLRVTGPRGVLGNDKFGTSCLKGYPYNYLVVNSAIGVKEEDIIKVIEKLKDILLN
ncbi:O-phosphoseryl-tRNA(Sec) selenium transferase [Methanocaldococcus indicus]|uniref:O-phosphoseryl-tRNA(Sec) selenium transferase n=1 Tax=Methanocaldococcus indicus TaxID=213231 RepID=UPI003C6CDA22